MASDEKQVAMMEQPLSEKASEHGSDTSTPRVMDKHAEKALLLKIDLKLLPVLLLLFLVSFVDRTNLGNANIEGLQQSLHMKGNQYNIALFVFNIPYVLLDIPSNLMLRKVKPGHWLGGMMFCWGKNLRFGILREVADSRVQELPPLARASPRHTRDSSRVAF